MEADHDAGFRPDVSVCGGGSVIAGPGWTLEAIPTPGHTSNHICYALLEENALFSGDHIMGWSTTVISPPDGDMADYLASLERIRARDFDTLWPTHGPPITRGRRPSSPPTAPTGWSASGQIAGRSWRPGRGRIGDHGRRASTPTWTRACTPPPPTRCGRT